MSVANMLDQHKTELMGWAQWNWSLNTWGMHAIDGGKHKLLALWPPPPTPTLSPFIHCSSAVGFTHSSRESSPLFAVLLLCWVPNRMLIHTPVSTSLPDDDKNDRHYKSHGLGDSSRLSTA